MGIGTSLVLIAAGAIMRFAVHVSASGFSIHTVGVILMIVGAIGLVLSLFMWDTLGFGHRDTGSRTVVREREVL